MVRVRLHANGAAGPILIAKVPPSFATAAVPGAAAEAFFGHESGDARRVKFVLLDLVL